MPTQSDVAKLAGVSTATVSRVINRRCVVTEKVRKRVQVAVDTLQYVPHAGARALALQRSGTLGAIVPTLNSAIFAEGINAFERYAQSKGYTFILAVSHNDRQQHFDLVMRMIERGVDGLLLVGNDHEAAVFDRLEKAEVRHVCSWAYDEIARAPNIGFNNAQAMHAVVDHLVEHGHRKFGMLAGHSVGNDRARQRVRGVVSRLNHHGLALSPRCIVEVEYSIKDSRKAFWELINNDMSAIICGNDVIAQGAVLEAVRMGLSIPGDISITGFDDLELSAEMHPALTSVHVNAKIMGEQAANALIDAVENSTCVDGCQLETRLVIRETSGPCQVLTQRAGAIENNSTADSSTVMNAEMLQ
ncbi:MAG: LacI family DNA-binding transcriptional regulator [Granulosicoccus sp.]